MRFQCQWNAVTRSVKKSWILIASATKNFPAFTKKINGMEEVLQNKKRLVNWWVWAELFLDLQRFEEWTTGMREQIASLFLVHLCHDESKPEIGLNVSFQYLQIVVHMKELALSSVWNKYGDTQRLCCFVVDWHRMELIAHVARKSKKWKGKKVRTNQRLRFQILIINAYWL